MLHFPRVITAMATPFTDEGAVDYDGVQALAAHLLDTGTEGLVVAGTTGESATMDHAETLQVFRATVEAVGDRGTILAGCGKNDTAATEQLVREATECGVDGILLVTPYYNRPSQRGLYQHFTRAAQATELPVMLYDIPVRTAREIERETLLSLATDVPNIVGVKDAVDDLVKTSWIAARAPQDFGIWSGNDASLLPMLSVGAVGIVSVAAHLVGNDVAALIEAFPSDPAKAREVHFRLAPLVAALFREPSPAPLKAALQMVGLPAGPVRAPLVEVEEATRGALRDALAVAGIDVDRAGARELR
jgi:4-hydroxy-tetrahydrodipicolinate synthase